MELLDAGWPLSIKNQSWVEDTENQVDFIIKTLALSGHERILDLACGFGRHSLALAQRGFSVVGVDLTKAFIADAIQSAHDKNLSVDFIHANILDLCYENEFDVVLNLADGAIGYFDNDTDNLKIFDVISRSLKSGGKHFMDICNAEHAEQFFPKRSWGVGTKMVSLPEFDWDPHRRRMLFSDWNINFGEIAVRPENIEKDANGIRLYSEAEVVDIMDKRQMKILRTFSNYYGKAASTKDLQLMVYSIKK